MVLNLVLCETKTKIVSETKMHERSNHRMREPICMTNDPQHTALICSTITYTLKLFMAAVARPDLTRIKPCSAWLKPFVGSTKNTHASTIGKKCALSLKLLRNPFK